MTIFQQATIELLKLTKITVMFIGGQIKDLPNNKNA